MNQATIGNALLVLEEPIVEPTATTTVPSITRSWRRSVSGDKPGRALRAGSEHEQTAGCFMIPNCDDLPANSAGKLTQERIMSIQAGHERGRRSPALYATASSAGSEIMNTVLRAARTQPIQALSVVSVACPAGGTTVRFRLRERHRIHIVIADQLNEHAFLEVMTGDAPHDPDSRRRIARLGRITPG